MIIVQALRKIQERCGWLPAEELRRLSVETKIPLHRLHEVASFYPHYRLRPPPAVEVRVCRDLSCLLRGAPALHRSLEAQAPEVGGDRVVVEEVSCLGQCDRAPAVSINDHIYRGLTEGELQKIVGLAVAREPLPCQKAGREPLGWKIDPYDGEPQYDIIRRFVANRDADEIIKNLEIAQLRGMGGAGFPTHRKWSAVRGAGDGQKYVVCNADESEPGTFKDRELMRHTPHLLVEGMVLAGLVTGATQGYVYIRHEYEEEIAAINEAIADAVARGVCGQNILGSGLGFKLETFVSPGGYICGEESALLEAMEDRRGEPRNKPPFPISHGLFGKPTVINNVETLSWVPAIVLHGGDWYKNQGVNGASGMRFVSISGDVNRAGVYEVPFGQTVRELIFDTAGGMFDGQKLKAIAPSGPSGGFLPAVARVENLGKRFVEKWVPTGAKTYNILDLPLSFETVSDLGAMLGGAFVVVGDRASMLDMALNGVAFFRNESCGKCVPCRLGSQQLTLIVEDMVNRQFPRAQLPVIDDLAEAMGQTSICGLGQVAANPITTVMKHFPEELKYL